MTWRFDYRRWDGTQDGLIDDTDAVLSELTDDLLANGDLHEALQRMLNRGWETPDGEQVVVHAGDDLPSAAYLAVLADIPELEPPTRALAGPDAAESPALIASALEFLLEGLHLTKRLNKDASGARALYRGRK